MAGRRRARTGRGWDAAPLRERSAGRAQPRVDTSPDVPYSGGDRTLSGAGSSDSVPPTGASQDRSSLAEATPTGATRGRASLGGASLGGASLGGASLDAAERAREICLRQLSFRPRTRHELATALRQRGIADEVAAEVLDRYSEVGMIDDQAFARAWVTSRHHGRGLAKRALASELRRRGVDDDAVGAALDDLDQQTEAQTARSLVDRKLRTERGEAQEAVFRRLVGMLARKGYPAGLAIRVVKEALEARAEARDQVNAFDVDQFDADLLDAEAREEEARRDEER